ncbi:sodium/sulfate symporter [Natrinema pellirubrum DSM 15624]|uniref:Di-/tricarboxylate transporter n=1 Tax=Natrinema pellirubrum (strain DSM 15624 / CIP 106293 / JCM 10476 / NCIMB 786 / 157) TaxID=797303 RepID=L0JML2_NATP1|nr:SLC13 family permease [Natrinema pellirubrum]AGB31797.1 di-/tricarboxylate transporter [Natrinema pellirubrum DSM 15624]ELY72351.1 sodium/sulfate symporter [Natrinema pellirubrum DSM 15624]
MDDRIDERSGVELPAPSWQTAGLFAAVGVLVVGTALDSPSALSVEGQRTLAVFLSALVLWLTRPVPYVISSVLSVTLLFVLGAVDSFGAATTGFTSTLVFFLLLLLLLGDATASVGLDQRLAGQLLTAESTPRRALRSVAGSVLALALVMPSAMARAVTFVPIVKRLAGAFDTEDGFESAAFLILGHVNPIASMALMTGGGMALVTAEIVSTSVGPITWVDWAVLMVPPTVLLYALAALAAGLFARVDGETTVSTTRVPRTEAGDDGLQLRTDGDETRPTPEDGLATLTRDQRLVAVVLLGAVAAWIGGSFVGLPTVVPAVAAVTVLSLPSVGVITADDIADVNWGIIFLIGAMLSILDAMNATGAITAVVDALTRLIPFAALSNWQIAAVLIALAVAIRVLFSTGSAAIVVALPIVLEFASSFGIDRLPLALTVLLVVGSTTILPFNTTAVLVSMDRGPLSHRDIAAFGLVTMALSIAVAALSWLVYWPLVR